MIEINIKSVNDLNAITSSKFMRWYDAIELETGNILAINGSEIEIRNFLTEFKNKGYISGIISTCSVKISSVPDRHFKKI